MIIWTRECANALQAFNMSALYSTLRDSGGCNGQ